MKNRGAKKEMERTERKTLILTIFLAASALMMASTFASPVSATCRPVFCTGEEIGGFGYCPHGSMLLISVKFANDTKVVGATVEVYNSTGSLVKNGTTDKYGLYGTCIPAGDYTANATKGELWKEVSFSVDGHFTYVKIILPGVYSVTIQVRHEDDTGIGGSYVEIVDSNNDTVASGDTDGNGDFNANLTTGDYKANVTSSSNGANKTESFSVPENTTVTVKFYDRVTVTVKFDNGTLVRKAYVEIVGTALTGFTGPNGEPADLGCGVLDPNTSYNAYAEKGDYTGFGSNKTNSDGGANFNVTFSSIALEGPSNSSGKIDVGFGILHLVYLLQCMQVTIVSVRNTKISQRIAMATQMLL